MCKLYIGGSSTQCGACGGNASPHDLTHISGGPGSCYADGSSLEDTNGCGADFTEVIWSYAGEEPELVTEARERIEAWNALGETFREGDEW